MLCTNWHRVHTLTTNSNFSNSISVVSNIRKSATNKSNRSIDQARLRVLWEMRTHWTQHTGRNLNSLTRSLCEFVKFHMTFSLCLDQNRQFLGLHTSGNDFVNTQQPKWEFVPSEHAHLWSTAAHTCEGWDEREREPNFELGVKPTWVHTPKTKLWHFPSPIVYFQENFGTKFLRTNFFW